MSDELRLPGGLRMRIHHADGAFTLLTDSAPPGWSLPPHRHLEHSETIHITAGALWVEVAGERRELRAGATAHVPAGTLHAGGTLGDAAVERVVVFSPGGMEAFFTALAAEPADPAALARDHGWRFS